MADNFDLGQPGELRAAAAGFAHQADQMQDLIGRCFQITHQIDEQGWRGDRAEMWLGLFKQAGDDAAKAATLLRWFSGLAKGLADKIEAAH